MEEPTPLTTPFHDLQNRIDVAMFAMNTFGPQGAKRLKKGSFSNKEGQVKACPGLDPGETRKSACGKI